MSDREDLDKPTKPKKVMTPEALERLKLAREKAAQVKKAARAEKDKIEQDLKEKEKAKRLAKMQEKVEKSYIDLDEEPKKEEPKKDVPIKPKKSKKNLVLMHDSGSSSDEDTQVIYIPKKKSNKSKDAPTRELTQEQQLPPGNQFGYAPRFRQFNSFY